jgi:glycerophosphoryl diester phosphodiesterase
MTRAAAHAKLHHNVFTPALSPAYETLLGSSAPVDVKALHAAGIAVVPWTINDPEKMRALLALHVDGIISDRPDLLAAVLKEARDKAAGDAAQLAYLDGIDAQGHRGGRGLRPENTLPAFESGLDNGINSIETDTGVTTDHQSLIWHDQFLNPQSCRRVDGLPYTIENRVYTHDISMTDAQHQFICDKLHFGPEQKNDLALSPVSVAFAAQEKMVNPYAPTYVAQLFRFVDFYARWYKSGAGKSSPHAAERARTAERVHFNLETKILPPGYSDAKMEAVVRGVTEVQIQASGKMPVSAFSPSRTVTPEVFVDTLCGVIKAYHMENRADVQSFDFRTLLLVQEKYPAIRSYYLTASPSLLNSDFTPESLRLPLPGQKP